MEVEYKWDLAEAGGPAALAAAEVASPYITGSRTIRMHATYYDSSEGLAREMHAGLRVRREDDASVCCLKLPVEVAGGLAKRLEYEVAATDVREGLRRLPEVGAPRDICERFLGTELVVLCETEFSRRAFALSCKEHGAEFAAELAVDAGVLRREGREREFHEMELELKGGSGESFRELAERIQDAGHLVPQPLSKLARAMQV